MRTSQKGFLMVCSALSCLVIAQAARAQLAPGTIPGMPQPVVPSTRDAAQSGYKLVPLSSPLAVTAGVLLLLDLEGRFAEDVAAGGGKAFGTWFAEDAVTLNNGKPAVLGRGAIATAADWDPKKYSLTWVAQGAQMGPSSDMGFTWGRYEGRSTGEDGKPVVVTGRYITVWKKLADGSWKVAMDASANEPPATVECCSVPRP